MLKKTTITLVLSFALIFLMVSSVAITADAPELTTSFKGGVSSVTIPGSRETKTQDPIIWDNGPPTSTLNYYSSQNDTCYPFVSQVADDFILDEDMLVTDVHWWGGFWNGPPDSMDPAPFWIYFYADDGTGNAPTGGGMADPAPTALASYYFPAVSGLPKDPNGHYEYDVVLSPPFSATAGQKYWIAVQYDSCYPPQWGWTNTSAIRLHSAVQGFPVLGMAFWTDIAPAADMAFYLTGVPREPWPDHKMHFPQLPDLEGWDVYAGFPKTLADDWQCSATGWVTDIHFWGSWKDLDGDPYTDDFYTPMPWFQLSIHRNIPATPDTPWSRPGEQVWFWEGEIPGTPFEPPAMEHWFNPNTGEVFYNDHVPYWRYDFFVAQASPPVDSFYQIKDRIYWLNVSAVQIPTPYQWGWKSSRDHFMDDAVYTDNPPVGPWYEMYEPPRANFFNARLNPPGIPPDDFGSTNYYGQGWYFYEMEDWWNMWFYDNPFTWDQPKVIHMQFNMNPAGGPFEFALNWSTPEWDTMEMGRPPLPADGNEDIYIGRQQFELVPGPNTIDFTLPYNPEWVSIDFRGWDFYVNGWIWHECVQTSMDLAFVITGHDGEPEESLYWKPDYDDYAPSGMPDIDQKQDNWFKQTTGEWSFCGPVAVANCFKWFDSKYNVPAGAPCDGADQFPLVRDYTDGLPGIWCFPPWDDHSPENMDHPMTPWLFGATPPPPATAQPFVPGPQPQPSTMPAWGELVERLAWYFNTDGVRYGYCTHSGTDVYEMQDGIQEWLESEQFQDGSTLADTLCENTWQKPTFALVESLVEKCEDVILLLGFWFEDPPGSGAWFRCGGHYVTVAGVNSEQFLIAVSDPYFNNAELGGRGRVRNGTIIPHFIPHTDATVHNDEGNVSHDIYNVTTQAVSPGGLWELYDYPVSVNPYDCERFHLQNVPVEFQTLSQYWNGYSPVFTEVEYAVQISPWDYRGDCNGDGTVNIGDVVCLVSYLFMGGPPPVPLSEGDATCDGVVNIGDAVRVVNYLFMGWPAPRCCDP